ncbi:MAG: methylated-DNA--[protein]-cysteine S-methyltransferase [Spirochaetaceae bacterium]
MLTSGTTESVCGTLHFIAQDQELIYCSFSPLLSGKTRLPGMLRKLLEENMPVYAGGEEEYPQLPKAPHRLGTLVSEYIARSAAGEQLIPPPMKFYGTEFQRKVWKALLDIPAGGVTTYRAVASAAGRPRAVRAAASAVATNPLAPIVPCHRVLPGAGGLGNYGGGVEKKRELLLLEGAPLSIFSLRKTEEAG